MTRTTAFSPRRDLIYVSGAIEGPRGATELSLIVDTGATHTIIVPEILDEIGYSARDGLRRSDITTAISREQGYTLQVARFATLGFAIDPFIVHVFDLEEASRFDGLVGLNFLRLFNYEVRSAEGRILLENLAPLAA